MLKPVRPQSSSRRVAQQRKQLEESAQTTADSGNSDTISCEDRQKSSMTASGKSRSPPDKGLLPTVDDKTTELLVDQCM